MRTRALTALVATTALLGLLAGAAQAGNPTAAVQEARILRTNVSEGKTAVRFEAVKTFVYRMQASPKVLAQGSTKLRPLIDATLVELPLMFGSLQAWKPQSTFGKKMRVYALWLTATQQNALAHAGAALVGIERKPRPAQLTTLRAVVKKFIAELAALDKARDTQLKAAGQGIPADELKAVSTFTLGG